MMGCGSVGELHLNSTRSTRRVTSPFPGLLRPEKLHIDPPADLPDVYGGIGLGGRNEECDVPVAERDGFAAPRDGPR